MGLAGQTSASIFVNVFSNILLYVHVRYIHELNSVQSNYCKGSVFVIKRLGEHLQLDHLRFVVAVYTIQMVLHSCFLINHADEWFCGYVAIPLKIVRNSAVRAITPGHIYSCTFMVYSLYI